MSMGRKKLSEKKNTPRHAESVIPRLENEIQVKAWRMDFNNDQVWLIVCILHPSYLFCYAPIHFLIGWPSHPPSPTLILLDLSFNSWRPHPISTDHFTCLCLLLPGKDTDGDLFSMYMLGLFKPWRNVATLCERFSTLEEALSNFLISCPEATRETLENLTTYVLLTSNTLLCIQLLNSNCVPAQTATWN